MSGLRRALLALGLLAFAMGVASVVLIYSSDHADPKGLAAALILVAAWGFVGTGLYAWDRRPNSNIGPLMTAVGFAWFFQALGSANNPALFTIGTFGTTLPFAILIQLLVTFPTGKLESRVQKVLAGVAYFVTIAMQSVWLLFADPAREGCDGCPGNPIRIHGHAALGEGISTSQGLIAIPLTAATVVFLYRRWRRSGANERRALTPVLATGGLAFILLFAQLVTGQLGISEQAERPASSPRWPPSAASRSPSSPASCAPGSAGPRRSARRSPPRTSSSTRSCKPRSPSCAPPGPGSSRRATRSAGGSSATSTTAPSSGWSRWP